MTPPYTARQLDYFRSALKILESAIFQAELSAELSVVEIAEQQIVTPAFVSPNEDIVTDNPQVIMTLEVSSSGVTPVATHALLAKTSAAEAPQIPASPSETVVAKPCKAFFQALPWQNQASYMAMPETEADNITAFVADTVVADKQTVTTMAEGKSNASAVTFFQGLPWQNQPSLAVTEITDDKATSTVVGNLVAEIVVVPASQEVGDIARAVSFFKSLPWQGAASPALPTNDFIANLSNGDFSAIANLATQTAIQAAQRSVQKQEQAPKIASQFFKALPW